ncbi:MAG: hypothetical protein KAJ79_08060 [Candidatus Omnitrophica bacterium]|nr:hypothetical protein [Candidatus Omnitrophota bacterium]MCK5289007.1 hypothetical protein [Candidatus Omnitrophota bacterium]
MALFGEKNLKDEAYFYAIADKDIKVEEKLIDLLKVTSKILDIDILIKDVDLVIEAATIEADKLILNQVF